jgi:DNA-binding transcriptional ArsR family regulator
MRSRADLVVRTIGDETVVYDPGTHRASCLAPVAAAVWRSWDGRASVAEVARRASETLGETVDERSVHVALRRLERAELVDALPSESRRRTPGRRAVIRGVGFAAGLAVWSVAVKSPAQAAATCLPNGRACVRSAQCCSSCCNSNAHRCAGGGNCAVP